jgi:hypothetical protein
MMEENKKGLKHDAGKAPVGMLFEYFPRSIMAVAEVAGFGARKYTRGGWVSVPDGFNRYQDAIGRHLLKHHIDGYDDESQLLHLAHAAWNALAILELELRRLEGMEEPLRKDEPIPDEPHLKELLSLPPEVCVLGLSPCEQARFIKASLDDQIESVAGLGVKLAAREEPYSAEEIGAVEDKLFDMLNDITSGCVREALRTTAAPTGAEVRSVRVSPGLSARYTEQISNSDDPYDHIACQIYSD